MFAHHNHQACSESNWSDACDLEAVGEGEETGERPPPTPASAFPPWGLRAPDMRRSPKVCNLCALAGERSGGRGQQDLDDASSVQVSLGTSTGTYRSPYGILYGC